MSAPSLSGKTAIVTGASSGIGRAIAETLGKAGAHVYLTGRTAAAMEASKKEIEAAGGQATVETFDVRDVTALQGFVARAANETGHLEIMVSNAGLSFPGAIADADPERWREMLEVNVFSLLVGAQAAIREMRRTSSEGHLVHISSVAAHGRESGVYGATKHAVNCIAGTLRAELENDTIRSVTIMPGAIATNFARNFDTEFLVGLGKSVGVEFEPKRGERLPDEVLEKIQPRMKELLGSPDDIADAVLYAVSVPNHVNVEEIVVRPRRALNLQ